MRLTTSLMKKRIAMPIHEEEDDWQITAEGLYIATRGFLTRRGYCCANRCRNCPYINWRCDPVWQPVAPECVHHTSVSPKAIAGARASLLYHERLYHQGPSQEHAYHQRMIEHYRHLLNSWKES
ncbi:MAG: hypothetical protein E6J34_12780 [Chloroflexi bacterium]|nr:MAG: hypothetical protein E6J34_12780 [Chloroflexota bacterium]